MTRLRRLMDEEARLQRRLTTLRAQIAAETRAISDAGGWRVTLRPLQALAELERRA